MKDDIAQRKILDSKVVAIALDIEKQFGVEFTKNSDYRHGDKGVHGTVPCRGIDLRCPDHHFGKLVENFVNQKYEYDADRPNLNCCWYHDSGDGYHLHLQSHPNTKPR